MNEVEKAQKIFQLFYLFRQENRHTYNKDGYMAHRDMMILHWMKNCHESECVKMNDIADHFHVTPAAVSQMMRHFEEKGWVERMILEHDRRSVYMKVSDQAIQFMKETEANIHQNLVRFLAYLGQEDSDALVRIMEKAVSYGKIL